MDEQELAGIAREYGTPTYVFDTQAFARRAHEVARILGPEVGLCYSIKANPFLVPTADRALGLLEVCSPGELAICERLGVPGEHVIYSGVCKGASDVREALRYGAGTFTAESPRQFALVEREAAAAGVVVPVLLRLNAGTQFGMSREDLLAIVDAQARGEHRGTRLVGLHYFAGTQRHRLSHQRRELAMLADLIDELARDHGWAPERLEYGPGLAVPLFEGDDFSDTLAPARELAPDLRKLAGRVRLTVEMGRFLATDCGSYLTRVVDEKEARDTAYALVDGGINHVTYYGQMMGMKVPRVRNLSARGREPGEGRSWCVCGSLCTTSDVLVRELRADVRVGDVLAFDNLGAYAMTEAMFLFLSRDLPRVVLRDEGGATLARDTMPTSTLNTMGAAAAGSPACAREKE